MERVARTYKRRPLHYLPALTAVLLLGFALRLHRLGAANLWWDEAFSIWLARKPLLEGVRLTARDVHPPLYYIILRAQIWMAGDTEFAARYLSAMAGTVTIAVLYPLGKRLVGRGLAVLGSLLLALSRFHIWWSQEVRMYTLAAFLVTLALFLLLRQTASGRRRWGWPLYTLSVAAALYTLYLAALIIPASGLALFILWRANRVSWPVVKSWLVATSVAMLLFLPWVLVSDPSQPGRAIGEVSPGFITSLYLALLSTGNSTDIGRYTLIALAYGAAIVGTLAALGRRRRWVTVALLAPPFVLPLLLAYLLILAPDTVYAPALEARYFLLFTPVNVLLLVSATALVARWRKWAGALLGAGILLVAAWSLPPHYAGRFLRDQWKSAVRIIDAYASPNDAIVVLSGDRYPLFHYEFDRLSREGLQARLLPDGVAKLTQANLDSQMEKAVDSADRVWLVEIEASIQDPDRLARAWMEKRMATALVSEFDHNRLTLFTPTGQLPVVPPEQLAPQQPLEAAGLLGIDLPIRHFRPGDTIHLGIYSDSGKLVIHMVHQSGLALAERTVSSSPSAGIIRHDVTFPVTQATPRGTYELMQGDITLATLQVAHSDPLWKVQDIPQPLTAEFGELIHLLGYQMTPTHPDPGDMVSVDLYWRTRAPVEHAFTVFVQIVGPLNPTSGTPLWGQHDGPPVGGAFATQDWPVGLIIRDRHELQFATAAPESDYAVIVGMYDPETGDRLPIPDHPSGALTIGEFSTP